MIFTGRNLRFVRGGIQLAIRDLQNQIVTCPDVFEYAEDLDEIEAEKAVYEKLLARIDRAIAKEDK
jgi:hypothetical protein